jgi:hypothetical protein
MCRGKPRIPSMPLIPTCHGRLRKRQSRWLQDWNQRKGRPESRVVHSAHWRVHHRLFVNIDSSGQLCPRV